MDFHEHLLIVEISDLVRELRASLSSEVRAIAAPRYFRLVAVCTVVAVLVEAAACDKGSLAWLEGRAHCLGLGKDRRNL